MTRARPSCRPIRVCVLLALLAGAGCANPGARLTGGSAQAEKEVGAQLAKQLETEVGLARDARLAAYVDEVGRRLARHAQRGDVQYRFQVVDVVAPNALALPGGHVYVSRGLLALTNSEDELAAVLGHEIAHVEARHAIKRSQAELAVAPLQVAAGLTGALASVISRGLGVDIASAGDAVLAPYSREQEREADRIGQSLAAQAGWRAQGLSSVLHTLDREEQRNGTSRMQAGFLASHPSTPDRAAAAAQRAAQLEPAPEQPIADERAAFLAKLDGLIVGDDPRRGIFVGNRYLHPAGLRMEFPQKWLAGRGSGSVGAVSPGRLDVIQLRAVALAADPSAVAQAQEKRAGVRLLEHARRLEINGLPAVQSELRVRGKKNSYWLLLTWVKLGEPVYLITAVSPVSRADYFGPIMQRAVATFGPLLEGERAEVKAIVLRVAQARPGETLAALRLRTGTVWEPDVIAIANGLRGDVRFGGGELVKLAVKEPF